MAKLSRKFIDNIEGRYYVDEACIDCDLCRQTAPDFFKRSFGGAATHSIVYRQPTDPADIERCDTALQDCPVNAIGVSESTEPRPTADPLPSLAEA